MSLKSLSAERPKFEPTKEFKIKQSLLTIIRKLYRQGYNVGDFRDLVNCIDTNHINPNSLNLPYDYPTLKKDILSGKYDSRNHHSNIDIDELERKIQNGELPNRTIRD